MLNNKALVEIFIPATGSTFDAFIPLESKVGEVLTLLSNALTDLSTGRFIATSSTVLCDANTGTILDINMTVADLGIKNGSRLMLI